MIEVVAGILIEDGRVLLTQRSRNSPMPWTWNCPGGKVEPGETHQQALAREWLEEIGCYVGVGNYVFQSDFEGYRVSHFTVHHSPAGQLPKALVDEGIGWFTAQDLAGLTCTRSLNHWKKTVIQILETYGVGCIIGVSDDFPKK